MIRLKEISEGSEESDSQQYIDEMAEQFIKEQNIPRKKLQIHYQTILMASTDKDGKPLYYPQSSVLLVWESK